MNLNFSDHTIRMGEAASPSEGDWMGDWAPTQPPPHPTQTIWNYIVSFVGCGGRASHATGEGARRAEGVGLIPI